MGSHVQYQPVHTDQRCGESLWGARPAHCVSGREVASSSLPERAARSAESRRDWGRPHRLARDWPALVVLGLTRLLLLSRFPSTHDLVHDWYNHADDVALLPIGALLARNPACGARWRQSALPHSGWHWPAGLQSPCTLRCPTGCWPGKRAHGVLDCARSSASSTHCASGAPLPASASLTSCGACRCCGHASASRRRHAPNCNNCAW
jgi:hypothetical protein